MEARQTIELITTDQIEAAFQALTTAHKTRLQANPIAGMTPTTDQIEQLRKSNCFKEVLTMVLYKLSIDEDLVTRAGLLTGLFMTGLVVGAEAEKRKQAQAQAPAQSVQ